MADPHLLRQLEGQVTTLEPGGLQHLQQVIQQRLPQQQR